MTQFNSMFMLAILLSSSQTTTKRFILQDAQGGPIPGAVLIAYNTESIVGVYPTSNKGIALLDAHASLQSIVALTPSWNVYNVDGKVFADGKPYVLPYHASIEGVISLIANGQPPKGSVLFIPDGQPGKLIGSLHQFPKTLQTYIETNHAALLSQQLTSLRFRFLGLQEGTTGSIMLPDRIRVCGAGFSIRAQAPSVLSIDGCSRPGVTGIVRYSSGVPAHGASVQAQWTLVTSGPGRTQDLQYANEVSCDQDGSFFVPLDCMLEDNTGALYNPFDIAGTRITNLSLEARGEKDTLGVALLGKADPYNQPPIGIVVQELTPVTIVVKDSNGRGLSGAFVLRPLHSAESTGEDGRVNLKDVADTSRLDAWVVAPGFSPVHVGARMERLIEVEMSGAPTLTLHTPMDRPGEEGRRIVIRVTGSQFHGATGVLDSVMDAILLSGAQVVSTSFTHDYVEKRLVSLADRVVLSSVVGGALYSVGWITVEGEVQWKVRDVVIDKDTDHSIL